MTISLRPNETVLKATAATAKSNAKDPPSATPAPNPVAPANPSLYLSLGKQQSSFKKSRGDAVAKTVQPQKPKPESSPRNNQEAPPPAEKLTTLEMAAQAYGPKRPLVSDFYSSMIKKHLQNHQVTTQKINNVGQKVKSDPKAK